MKQSARPRDPRHQHAGRHRRRRVAQAQESTKTKAVPVIIITGSTDEKLPDEVIKLGAKIFLSKPIEPTSS
jgi:FixJ family two-component response regulator